MDLKNMFTLSTRNIFRVFAFCMLATTVACTSEELTEQPIGSDGPITFRTNINGNTLTRATDAAWAADDSVGIFMHDAAGELSEAYHRANKRYKAADSTQTSNSRWTLVPYDPNNELYFPLDSTEVRFTAYYPYNETITVANNKPGSYPVILGDQKELEKFDFLFHRSDTLYKRGGGNTPAMQFKHKLSKVIVNIKLGDGMVSGTSPNEVPLIDSLVVTILDVPTSANFNMADSVFSDWGVSGLNNDSIIMAKTTVPTANYDSTYVAIVVPHNYTPVGGSSPVADSYTNRRIGVLFKDPDGVVQRLYYNIPDNKAFNTEKRTIYNFTLKRYAIVVDSVTILDWVTDSTDGTITGDL